MMFRLPIRKLFRTLLLFTSIFLLSYTAYGQANINSPYSRFGVGDLEPQYFGESRSLSGVATPIREPNAINFFNPASYSALRITTLEAGLRFNFTQLSSLTDKQFNYNGQYGYLSLGFPLGKKWGVSLGLVPYSNMGYYQSQSTVINVLGPQNTIYNGEGGLTQFYAGTGYEVIKGLSLGVNFGYIFGNLSQVKALEFAASRGASSDTIYNSRISTKTENGGFQLGYGLQYEINLNPDSRITLAYSGTYKAVLVSREMQFTERYSSNSKDNQVVLDTTNRINNGKSSSSLPITHNAGISYRYRDKFLLAGDFQYQRWSKFIYLDANPGYTDSYRANVAAQFTPDLTSVSNYLALFDYRLGVSYGQSFLTLNNQRIKQYSGTVGFGIPIRGGGGYNANQVGAKINLGFEFGRRGTLNDNLVLENYLNVHLGFALNQLWFYRKKYQ